MLGKVINNLGKVLLGLGGLLFIVSSIAAFMEGYLNARNKVLFGTAEFGIDYYSYSFVLLIIGLLLVVSNRIITKIKENKL
ncbi:hypothetical protein EDC18_101513 [Natranaerovirga pectinivora]|uniref:Uncharacterized protein n=1 Tax=Natranaerovirga pectinivora TaxID=682400 RepID=A0A4R3MPJ6_9FIRM|nr:hypothetical protein [Natranaerovirga pectinivora]TCT17215.1 hypothetical protein EDC18_101513 [Natranaerovirga pectinivora]